VSPPRILLASSEQLQGFLPDVKNLCSVTGPQSVLPSTCVGNRSTIELFSIRAAAQLPEEYPGNVICSEYQLWDNAKSIDESLSRLSLQEDFHTNSLENEDKLFKESVFNLDCSQDIQAPELGLGFHYSTLSHRPGDVIIPLSAYGSSLMEDFPVRKNPHISWPTSSPGYLADRGQVVSKLNQYRMVKSYSPKELRPCTTGVSFVRPHNDLCTSGRVHAYIPEAIGHRSSSQAADLRLIHLYNHNRR